MQTSRHNRPNLRVVHFDAGEFVAEDRAENLSGEAPDRSRVRAVLWEIAAHGTGILVLAQAIWLVGPSIGKAVFVLLAASIAGVVLFCVWGSE